MKIRVAVIMLGALLAAPYSFSDQIKVPFAIYVEEFKAEAKELGLDLYDTKESDGFIENHGSNFTVCTYKPVKKEIFDVITKLTWKHLRK